MPDPAALKSLRKRVAKANGPDWMLDAEIAAAFKYYVSISDAGMFVHSWGGEWKAINGRVHLLGSYGSGGNFRPEHFTASIDATLALVERVLPVCDGWPDDSLPSSGWKIGLYLYRGTTPIGANDFASWECMIRPHAGEVKPVHGPTAPLAILLALLDALLAQQSETETP